MNLIDGLQRLEALAVASVLVAALAGTVLGQTSDKLAVVTPSRTFLSKLPPRFTIRPGEAGYPRDICRQSFLRCPAVLVFGGAGGGLPTIDPRFKVYAPNVRVSSFTRIATSVMRCSRDSRRSGR